MSVRLTIVANMVLSGFICYHVGRLVGKYGWKKVLQDWFD